MQRVFERGMPVLIDSLYRCAVREQKSRVLGDAGTRRHVERRPPHTACPMMDVCTEKEKRGDVASVAACP